MKKLFALLLVVLMMFNLTACSLFLLPLQQEATKKQESTLTVPKNPALVAYLEQTNNELLSSMEESFATSSGMTCTSSIEVVGNGFEIYININELEDLPEITKTAMQKTYDGMDVYWDAALLAMQEDLPEVEYMKVYVCEKDGDVIAIINMD